MERKVLDLKRKTRGGFHSAVIAAAGIFLTMTLLLTISVSAAYSDEIEQPAGIVSGVRFAVSGLQVTIRYDLRGDRNEKYKVSLVLRRRSDPSFRYLPKELSGDIGLGRYAGTDRKIVWNMRNEFPQGLQGNDFYFVVNANEVERKRSAGILTWIGAGAVAVAAVVTYLMVMHSGSPTSPASFPIPPGRP